eukprot:SAG11_NODE_3035_length_2748_cov_3.895432_2_plen_66_part_00
MGGLTGGAPDDAPSPIIFLPGAMVVWQVLTAGAARPAPGSRPCPPQRGEQQPSAFTGLLSQVRKP